MPIPANKGLRGYSYKAVSEDAQIFTGTDTLVQQSPAEDADINNIVRRFGITRQMPFGATGGLYGDFTDIADYAAIQSRMERVDRAFETLPAEVRERFGNDPGNLVKFSQSASYEDFLDATAEATPPVVDPPPVG